MKHMKGKKYCKFHHTYCHMTSNYVHFKNTILDKIEQGRLKFEEKSMKVDNDPFKN